MGNIVRKVEVCGLTGAGELGKCVLANAVVDTGATKTVITPELAAHVRASRTPVKSPIEGRKIPVNLTMMKLHEPGCDYAIIPAAVDAKLAARAGKTDDGKRIDVILGHDYTQEYKATITYGERAENHSIKCGGRRGNGK